MQTHRRVKAAACFVLIASTMLTAGCGGGGGGGQSSAGNKSSAAAPDKARGGGSSGAFCAALKSQLKELNALFPKDFSDTGQLKRYGEFVKKSNAILVKTAPGEIAADVRLQARISDAAADAYIKGAAPRGAALNDLRSPEYLAAAKKVSAYAKEHCGIGAPSAPSS